MKWSIEDFVYGASDGAVTTFAVVAGALGASLSPAIILILGFANLFADGLSMSIGSYLSTKTRKELIEKERKKEEWEIDNMEDEEKNEIREIYEKKGFKDDLLEDIVRIITSRRKVWLDTMMKEELGLIDDPKNPIESAATTFVAFNLIGIIPLVPFIFLYVSGLNSLSSSNASVYSIIFTAVAFFVIGIIKGKFVGKSIITSGLSTLGVGAIAALAAYLVGFLLGGLLK
jgi:VIT1/CCC1 family predicted Fe2+/Mn2+ transporter